mmetsp:Transcript_20275/g.30119  ORF Transcript_20275/g.30119 Transcript_20275/m.30119 type:complete len:342 (+) Transcript_20275:48-1073(+)
MGLNSVLVSTLYSIGCIQLIPASILYLPAIGKNETATYLFIECCGCLLLAALLDVLYRFLLESTEKNNLISYLTSLAMLLGGVFFESGSILYLESAHRQDEGTWVFRTGSVLYLCGSLLTFYGLFKSHWSNFDYLMLVSSTAQESPHSTSLLLDSEQYGAPPALESLSAPKKCMRIYRECFSEYEKLAMFTASAFFVGAIFYIIGGILSQANVAGFAQTWIIGSVLFAIGAFTNAYSMYKQYFLKTSENKKRARQIKKRNQNMLDLDDDPLSAMDPISTDPGLPFFRGQNQTFDYPAGYPRNNIQENHPPQHNTSPDDDSTSSDQGSETRHNKYTRNSPFL